MKSIYYSIIMVLMIFTSCTEDDTKPTILTTTPEYALTVLENVKEGDTVGIVPGTSNKGTITYKITSQAPDGAFTIGENYGELVVADPSFFEAGKEIALQISLTKEEIAKTSSVIVMITEPCVQVGLDSWAGDLSFEEEGVDPIEGIGITNDCGQLTIQGDIANRSCDLEIEIEFQLIPSAEDSQKGTILAERQPYNCIDETDNEFEATGEYDIIEGVITIDYIVYEDGEEIAIGNTSIRQPKTDPDPDPDGCDSMVMTTIWEGTISIESKDEQGNPIEDVAPFDGEGVSGCGALLVKADLGSFDCDTVPEINLVFTPNSEGATNGTVTAEQQNYNCYEDATITYEASGTYDETTKSIELNYTITEEGQDAIKGVNSIKVN